MANNTIKTFTIRGLNDDSRDIGAEAQNIEVSYDSEGRIIKDITEPGVVIDHTGPLTDILGTVNPGVGLEINSETGALDVKYGSSEGTAAQGNDSRLSDDRKNPNKVTFTDGTNDVEYDGSEAITVNRSTLGAAPANHASASTEYGIATKNNYGHVKVGDGINVTNGVISASSSFAGLTDTNITSPSNGQVPVYNNTSQKWENKTVTTGDMFKSTYDTNNDGIVNKADRATAADKVKFDSYDISFGIDENGNYGYIKAGADTVTPFSKPISTTDIIINNRATTDQIIEKFYDDEVIKNDLPLDIDDSCAVVYNNEIHLLGRSTGTTRTIHYKWDGTSWTSVSTLPINPSSAVIYNNEIHILGGRNQAGNTGHYKWNGTSWTSVSTLPYDYENCKTAVVYNNEIHIFGTGDVSSLGKNDWKKHYKWDGSSWINVGDSDYNINDPDYTSVVYNNKIYIRGPLSNKLVVWDGTSWGTTTATCPMNLRENNYGSLTMIVYNDEIHLFNLTYNYPGTKVHYVFDGMNFIQANELNNVCAGCADVVYDNKIHLLGGSSKADYYLPKMHHIISEVNTAKKITVRSLPEKSSLGLLAGNNVTLTPATTELGLSKATVSAASLSSQTSGTATANKILRGYTAWVNGEQLTGICDHNGGFYFTQYIDDGSQSQITIETPNIYNIRCLVLRGGSMSGSAEMLSVYGDLDTFVQLATGTKTLTTYDLRDKLTTAGYIYKVNFGSTGDGTFASFVFNKKGTSSSNWLWNISVAGW